MQSDALEREPAPCAEFPNDNPGLHGGAIWRCFGPSASPSCELPAAARDVRPRSSTILPPPRVIELEALEELEPLGAPIFEAPGSLRTIEPFDALPDATGEDPFARLVAALESTGATLGINPNSLACLRALFGLARWDGYGLEAESVEALVSGHVLASVDGVLALSSAFTDQVSAWQRILRGESEDFVVSSALDEWAADVLARLLGNPIRADAIRRELRRRGVAAFGIVADAA